MNLNNAGVCRLCFSLYCKYQSCAFYSTCIDIWISLNSWGRFDSAVCRIAFVISQAFCPKSDMFFTVNRQIDSCGRFDSLAVLRFRLLWHCFPSWYCKYQWKIYRWKALCPKRDEIASNSAMLLRGNRGFTHNKVYKCLQFP